MANQILNDSFLSFIAFKIQIKEESSNETFYFVKKDIIMCSVFPINIYNQTIKKCDLECSHK